MYGKTRRCNGISSIQHRLRDDTIEVLVAIAARQRPGFIERANTHRDLLAGRRFSNDDCLIARVATAYTNDEVIADIEFVVYDGLFDCAASDHWYEFEKEYG